MAANDVRWYHGTVGVFNSSGATIDHKWYRGTVSVDRKGVCIRGKESYVSLRKMGTPAQGMTSEEITERGLPGAYEEIVAAHAPGCPTKAAADPEEDESGDSQDPAGEQDAEKEE